jgi:polyhydroxybutyrate depolymerase
VRRARGLTSLPLPLLLAAGLGVASTAGTAGPTSLPRSPAAIGASTVRAVSAAAVNGRHYVASGSYLLYVPAAGTAPRALVVVLPGADQSAAYAEASYGIDAYAGRTDAGFAVVYGEGSPLGKWNASSASPACCGSTRDDVTYLRQVVADAAKVTPLDLHRVYLWGFSLGGMMTYRALCEAPDVFAAGLVVAGSMLHTCGASVNVLHIHGVADTTVPQSGLGYYGITYPPLYQTPLRMPAAAIWTLLPHAYGHIIPGWAWHHGWYFDKRFALAGA